MWHICIDNFTLMSYASILGICKHLSIKRRCGNKGLSYTTIIYRLFTGYFDVAHLDSVACCLILIFI